MVVTVLYVASAAALAPFFLLLLLVTLAAVIPRGSGDLRAAASPDSLWFLFVIPARDEEGTIRRTVESCRAVDYDPERFTVCVIADNCTDDTAGVARLAGAEVVERSDPVRQSKGYALEDFFAGGTLDRFDAVVVVDADSVVDPGILDAFAGGLAEGRDWMQGYYSVRNPDASWRTRLMTYAFSLFNGVWLLGQDRLGLGVALRGNGMCVTARGLARVPWRVHGLTEDLEFSWVLRLAGERVRFVPRARVLADMLSRGGPAAAAQRRRWEVGRRDLRRQFLGPLLRSRVVDPYWKALYLIDLLFPSLVGLLLALLATVSVHLGPAIDARVTPLSRALLPVHAAMAAVLAAYALSPVIVMRLPARYLLSLAALPYYAVWKVTTTLGRRPTAWVRSRREPSIPAGSGS